MISYTLQPTSTAPDFAGGICERLLAPCHPDSSTPISCQEAEEPTRSMTGKHREMMRVFSQRRNVRQSSSNIKTAAKWHEAIPAKANSKATSRPAKLP